MPESIVQMLESKLLELWQTRCCGHCPGEPVPVLNHPLGEEPFPNIQPEPPLMQLHAVPLGPVAVPREQSSAPAPLVRS